MKILLSLLLFAMLTTANLANGQELRNTSQTVVDISEIDSEGAQLIRFHIGAEFEVDRCNKHELNGTTYPLEYGLGEVSIIIKVKSSGTVTSTGRACTDPRRKTEFLHYSTYQSRIYDTKIKFVHPEDFEVRYTLIYESDLIDPNDSLSFVSVQ